MGNDPTLTAVRLWNEFEAVLQRGDRQEILALLGCIQAWRYRLMRAASDGSGIDSKARKPRLSYRLLTASEIAKLTGLSARYFYEHTDKPFAVRLSERRLRFDLAKFLEWRAEVA